MDSQSSDFPLENKKLLQQQINDIFSAPFIFSPPKDVLVSDSAVSALQRIAPTNRGFTTKD
jgi:hypothetical protein